MTALIILFIAAMWAGMKNALNASAVAIFAFSMDVHWLQALVTAIGASFGGWAGADAETRQREAAEARRRRHRRRAHDRAVLDGLVAVRMRERSDPT
jgi:hypothetical protein